MYNLGTQVGVEMWMISTSGVFREESPGNFNDYEWLKFGCQSEEKQKLDIMISELSKYEELELTNSLPINVEVNPKGVRKARAL
ncbi:phosphoglycolate phosphatase, partial [Staphylococcus sp. SIMBA_130]